MASYCYRNHKGRVEEMQFPMGKAPARLIMHGQIWLRDRGSEWKPSKPRRKWMGGNPWRTREPSNSCGVLAHQKKDAEQDAVARGVPTEFKLDDRKRVARPVIRSQDHFKAFNKAYGLGDLDGYY